MNIQKTIEKMFCISGLCIRGMKFNAEVEIDFIYSVYKEIGEPCGTLGDIFVGRWRIKKYIDECGEPFLPSLCDFQVCVNEWVENNADRLSEDLLGDLYTT